MPLFLRNRSFDAYAYLRHAILVGLFCVYNRSLLPYGRPLLTLAHTSGRPKVTFSCADKPESGWVIFPDNRAGEDPTVIAGNRFRDLSEVCWSFSWPIFLYE